MRFAIWCRGASAALAIAALIWLPRAQADDAAHCKAPTWAPQAMPGFVIDSCEHKAWVSDSVDLPAGSKTVAGERWRVDFALKDASKNPSNDAARAFFVAAGKRVGATLLTDPAGGWTAILTQKTPQGEFYYEYEHGTGNDDSTESYTLTTWKIAPFPQAVVAQVPKGALLDDMQGKGCKTPPWLVKQFDYYKLTDCTKEDLDSITLDLPGGSKTLAGRFLELNFTLTDEKKDASALYVQKNYINALKKIGATLVSDPTDIYKAVLTQKMPQGELWYIYTHTSGNEESTGSYSLTALQVGGPPSKVCKLEVYGIQFDFNKSEIKPESAPVLQQMLALFTADPAYKAEIGGHTDNVGGNAYNMKLSGQRADAVRAWLVAHGVAADRISSHGYGYTQPLVPNDSDANRAKNRRVELKRKDCHT